MKCRTGKRSFTEANGASRGRPDFKKARVRAIETDSDETDPKTESSFIYRICDDDDDTVTCNVGGIDLDMLIDSGSTHNIVDEVTWRYLHHTKWAFK